MALDQQQIDEKVKRSELPIAQGSALVRLGFAIKRIVELERERDEALATVRELRQINVLPGITLGMHEKWLADARLMARALQRLQSAAEMALQSNFVPAYVKELAAAEFEIRDGELLELPLVKLALKEGE